jgi:hypothetical protein
VRFFVLSIVLTFAILPTRAFAGPLQDIEDSATASNRKRSSTSTSRSSGPAHERGDGDRSTDGRSTDDDETSFWAYVFLMPWLVPRMLVDDPCLHRYAPYPYLGGRGQLRVQSLQLGCLAPPDGQPLSRAVSAQLSLEGSYALARVAGGALDARLQLPKRFEFLGRVGLLNDFSERPHDQALHGTAHLSYRFAQAAHIEMRTAIGIRSFGLHRPLHGIDLLYGMDLFARRPITGRVELHVGSLGQAGVAQARVTMGGMVRNIEIYAGWDSTAIWGKGKTTRLRGPILGVRAWF